jgi:hypothetical protein
MAQGVLLWVVECPLSSRVIFMGRISFLFVVLTGSSYFIFFNQFV